MGHPAEANRRLTRPELDVLRAAEIGQIDAVGSELVREDRQEIERVECRCCLLYTSDAADE